MSQTFPKQTALALNHILAGDAAGRGSALPPGNHGDNLRVNDTALNWLPPVHTAGTSPTAADDGGDSGGAGRKFVPGDIWLNAATVPATQAA